MSAPRGVLILSASPDQWELAFDLLAKRGITARCIGEPYRFIAAFASEPCDLIVVDAEGFRKQDLEILRVSRELKPDCGLVVLVDRDQHEIASSLLVNGADLYLLKPVAAQEIIEAVERASRRLELADTQAGGSRRAERLSMFAVGVTQKVNDALAVMKMSLQLLQQDVSDNPQVLSRLTPISDEIDRVANLSRQLLGFARQTSRAAESVDMARIVSELGRVYAAQCRDKGITVTADVSRDVPACGGDEGQLRQACDAILEQTVSAMNDMNGTPGRIGITCRSKANGIEIVFEDNGPRIPDMILHHVFDPLQAGRRDGAREMGLAMASGIIESHGGKIEAYSDDTPVTRFIVWLPCRK
jgi:signal transduction histidine kinase